MPGEPGSIKKLPEIQQVHVRVVKACADKVTAQVHTGVILPGEAEQLFGITHLQKALAFHREGLLKGELSGIYAPVVIDGFHCTACSFFAAGTSYSLRCSGLYRPVFSLSIG